MILWGFWEAGKSSHHVIAVYDLFITFEELCHAAVWGTFRMFELVAQQLLTSITWPEGPESLDDMSHKGTFISETNKTTKIHERMFCFKHHYFITSGRVTAWLPPITKTFFKTVTEEITLWTLCTVGQANLFFSFYKNNTLLSQAQPFNPFSQIFVKKLLNTYFSSYCIVLYFIPWKLSRHKMEILKTWIQLKISKDLHRGRRRRWHLKIELPWRFLHWDLSFILWHLGVFPQENIH